jgi:hypothetical protein
MGDNEKVITREEFIGLIQLVVLFTAILLGREIGNIYSTYNEVSRLSVNLNVPEEEIARYLRDSLQGNDAKLRVGLAITIPGYIGSEGSVTQTPDYVRKWLISVTLSPIVVRQPEVSDVELTVLLEGEKILSKTFSFPREKVGYISFVKRSLDIRVDDKETFKQLVRKAAEKYGGEVNIQFTGKVKTHLLFLESLLPFTTKSYPFVSAPKANIISTQWSNQTGEKISTSHIGKIVFTSIDVENPTRIHSITQNVTCKIFKEDKGISLKEPVFEQTKQVIVASSSNATYVFLFTPPEAGVYRYYLETYGFTLKEEASPVLNVIS